MIFYYRWRKIQQLGLASEYKNEQSPIGTWLKHLFGLTFLPPAEVGDCFAEDFMCEKPENSKLDQFADYLVDRDMGGKQLQHFKDDKHMRIFPF
jgi:hypothetical protein